MEYWRKCDDFYENDANSKTEFQDFLMNKESNANERENDTDIANDECKARAIASPDVQESLEKAVHEFRDSLKKSQFTLCDSTRPNDSMERTGMTFPSECIKDVESYRIHSKLYSNSGDSSHETRRNDTSEFNSCSYECSFKMKELKERLKQIPLLEEKLKYLQEQKPNKKIYFEETINGPRRERYKLLASPSRFQYAKWSFKANRKQDDTNELKSPKLPTTKEIGVGGTVLTRDVGVTSSCFTEDDTSSRKTNDVADLKAIVEKTTSKPRNFGFLIKNPRIKLSVEGVDASTQTNAQIMPESKDVEVQVSPKNCDVAVSCKPLTEKLEARLNETLCRKCEAIIVIDETTVANNNNLADAFNANVKAEDENTSVLPTNSPKQDKIEYCEKDNASDDFCSNINLSDVEERYNDSEDDEKRANFHPLTRQNTYVKTPDLWESGEMSGNQSKPQPDSKEILKALHMLKESLRSKTSNLEFKNFVNIVKSSWFNITRFHDSDAVLVEDSIQTYRMISSKVLKFVVNLKDAADGYTALTIAVEAGYRDIGLTLYAKQYIKEEPPSHITNALNLRSPTIN